MQILEWSDAGEIKELHCGNKPVVVQCLEMGCDIVKCNLLLPIGA